MKFIDMHCDTLMPFAYDEKYSLYQNNKQVDFLKLKQGDCLAQFFAVFFPPEEHMQDINDDLYFEKLTDGLDRFVTKHNDIIAMARNYDEIIANQNKNKVSAFLTIEDSRFINGDMSRFDMVYNKGVRAMSLIWNFENCFGFPNTDDEHQNTGLKPFGVDAISVMNDKGILIDVSHLNDGGFYDVVKYSKQPFLATHSNSRSITNHSRNLTDDMIKIMGNTGSVTGLNFFSKFMHHRDDNHTTIQDIVNHAKHIVNVGGIDCLGIGTDFDGISGTQDIDDSSKMPQLYPALSKAGFTDDDIEKIAYKNVLRVIKDVTK